MSPKIILRFAAAIGAVAAAAAVVVVAASYGVYALARIWLTAAGASAVVAAVFAVIAVVIAALALGKRPRTAARAAKAPASPVDRIIEVAKERPLIALGAVAVAGFVLVRNPALVTAVVTSFLAGEKSNPPK